MKSLLPIDELNALAEKLRAGATADAATPAKQKIDDEIEDEIEELLILAYVYGSTMAREALGLPLQAEFQTTVNDIQSSVYKKTAGKTFLDRVREYAETGDVEAIIRVADTEMHRIYCEGELTTAKNSGARTKKWITMMDDKVRDTHELLLGVTVGIDEKFYTIDGDEAEAPGGFQMAENNVNCRCELTFSR